MVILRAENGQLGSRRREILRGSTIIGANFDNRNSQYGLAKQTDDASRKWGASSVFIRNIRFYRKRECFYRKRE